MNGLGNAVLSVAERKEKYDNTMKEILANKQFLARIIKQFVPEFVECSVEDIENKYIETETISTSKVGVARNLTNIEGISNEDKTLNEGNIHYDIIFRVNYPNIKASHVGMYINIEMQKDYYPGYPLEMRGAYYAARRFSSQLKSISKKTNYGCLKKVYSIWLCVGNVPNFEANTVTLYQTTKYDIIGSVERNPEIYTLMDVIIIRINDKMKSENETLQLLQTICSNNIGKKEKLETLKKQGIRIEDIEEGVEYMCNLSDLIEEKGIEQGIEKGIEKGKREITIRMHQYGLPIEEIAQLANAPITLIRQWLKEEKLIK